MTITRAFDTCNGKHVCDVALLIRKKIACGMSGLRRCFSYLVSIHLSGSISRYFSKCVLGGKAATLLMI